MTHIKRVNEMANRISEEIKITKNPNAGKSVRETQTCREEVVQAIINAFLTYREHPNASTYCSSDVSGDNTRIDLKKNIFGKHGEYPNVAEMQKAFDILIENGYYVFVETERHRGIVKFNYRVGDCKDSFSTEGYKPTTKFEKYYYIY